MIFVVRTGDGQAFVDTVNGLPDVQASLVEESWDEAARTCKVEVSGNVGFFEFAVQQQGYGEIVAHG